MFCLQPPTFGTQNGYHTYTSASDNESRGGRAEEQQVQPGPAEWTNIIPTIDDPARTAAQVYKNSFSYTGNFVFYGLLPSTDYEVIIQSRNKEGWSNASDIFRFSTRSRGTPAAYSTYCQTGSNKLRGQILITENPGSNSDRSVP